MIGIEHCEWVCQKMPIKLGAQNVVSLSRCSVTVWSDHTDCCQPGLATYKSAYQRATSDMLKQQAISANLRGESSETPNGDAERDMIFNRVQWVMVDC